MSKATPKNVSVKGKGGKKAAAKSKTKIRKKAAEPVEAEDEGLFDPDSEETEAAAEGGDESPFEDDEIPAGDLDDDELAAMFGPDEKAATADALEGEGEAEEPVVGVEMASTVLVQKQFRSGGDLIETDDAETEELEIRRFLTAPAKVSSSMGMTLSMGEGTFEFVRVDVTVEVPCYAEEIEDAYDYARTVVRARLKKDTAPFRAARKK